MSVGVISTLFSSADWKSPRSYVNFRRSLQGLSNFHFTAIDAIDVEFAYTFQQPLPPRSLPQFTHQAEFGMDDDVSPTEARIKRLKAWRQLAVRGASGLKFRREVAAAYE